MHHPSNTPDKATESKVREFANHLYADPPRKEAMAYAVMLHINNGHFLDSVKKLVDVRLENISDSSTIKWMVRDIQTLIEDALEWDREEENDPADFWKNA